MSMLELHPDFKRKKEGGFLSKSPWAVKKTTLFCSS